MERENAPLALAYLNHKLVLAVCPSGAVEEIKVSERNLSSSDSEWKVIWLVQGNGQFGANSLIDVGTQPSGFHLVSAVDPTIDDGAQFSVRLIRSRSDGTYLQATFPGIQAGELADGSWLQSDGTKTTSPC